MQEAPNGPAVLARLTDEARRAIALVSRPLAWDSGPGADLDVAIIGGGQSGIGAAFALSRVGVTHVGVFDAAPKGAAGVWATTARMETLRTDKAISGIDQGIPALTFERWFAEQWGEAAYRTLGRIPRLMWQDYLDWFQRTVAVDIRHDMRLIDVDAAEVGLRLTFSHGGSHSIVTARRLVLATGVDGLGMPFVPEVIRSGLPAGAWAHTADPIDFSRLAGRRIAVIGAASSAFDAAATALEAGASQVHLLSRARRLATQSPQALARNPVLYRPFRDLPDRVRWQIITRGRARGHAPQATIDRAGRHPNFHLLLGREIASVRQGDDGIEIKTGQETLSVDFIIAGTGYRTDLATRPELSRIAKRVRLWREVPGIADDRDAVQEWGGHPYLDRELAFTERVPGTAPWVRRIHIFNYGAVVSHGYHVGDIGSHDTCIRRLREAIQDGLFRDSADRLVAPLLNPPPAAETHPARPIASQPARQLPGPSPFQLHLQGLNP